MEVKFKLSDKEKHVLKCIFAYVLSFCVWLTGIYSVCYFQKLGIITGQKQIMFALIIVSLQIYLTTIVIFKYYK